MTRKEALEFEQHSEKHIEFFFIGNWRAGGCRSRKQPGRKGNKSLKTCKNVV